MKSIPDIRVLAAAGLVLRGVCSTALGATTWYVATNGNDGALGSNGWGSAFLTISNAVAKAANNDTILVSNGTYVVTSEIMIQGKALRVKGFNGRDVTIVDGNYPTTTNRCFYLSQQGSTLEGLTLQNAGAGAVFIENYCTITNCIIKNNWSGGDAGGIYFWGGAGGGLAVNCIISNNTAAGYGGGVKFYSGGTVTNCTITCNAAANGGGVCFANIAGKAIDCVISGNSVTGATATGGGVNITGAGSIMQNCIISNNSTSYRGGGIFCGLSATVQNCKIVNNTGEGLWLENASGCTTRNLLITGNSGGGVFFLGVNGGTLQSSTVCSNASYGVYFYDTSADGGRCQNCIVYFNTTNYVNWQNGYTNSLAYTCIAPTNAFNGPGIVGANPLFAADSYQLQARSPCLNAGSNQTWMATAFDLDGRPRILPDGGIVDIGAYEWKPKCTVITTY